MELRVYEYALPLVSPFVFGYRELRERRGWLVELRDGDVTGWGEAAPLPGFGAETEDEVRACWAGVPDGIAAGECGHLPRVVRCALETARCDLAARRARLPLAQWLVPSAALVVKSNATVGGGDVRLRRIRIAAAVREGYTTLKLKTGGMVWCDELDVLEEIATLYPGVRLRLDPNALWTLAESEQRLRSVRDLPVEYVEQPVAAEDIDGLLTLAAGPDGDRVAADEALLGGGDAVARLMAPGGVRRVVLKPAALGGPLTALSMIGLAVTTDDPRVAATRAANAWAGVTVTTMLESAVGRAMAAHVAAAVDAALGAGVHGLSTGSLLGRDVADWPDGPLQHLRGPGLGLVPDVSGLERVR